MNKPLTPAQEEEAQQLAKGFAEAASEEFLKVARTLVGTETTALFGQTEFTIRDVLLRIGAKVYQQYLEQKKTATKAPA
jgi:hypothetical protein